MLTAVTCLAAGLGVGLVPERQVFNYLWADPSFCGSCHAHDYANEAFDRSVHAGLTTCHDCHLVPISHYPHNLWMMLTDRPQTPDDIAKAEIPTIVCTQCHSKEGTDQELTGPMPDALRQRVVKVDSSPLHQIHMRSETRRPTPRQGGGETDLGEAPGVGGLHLETASWDKGTIACTDCHGLEGERAHQFTAARDLCLDCHEDTQLHGGSMATADCRQCHLGGFLAASETAAAATP